MDFINRELNRFQENINKKYEFLKNQGLIPTLELIKNELNKIYKPAIMVEKKNEFFQLLGNFIDSRKKQHAVTTIKKHITLRNVLLEFQDKEKYKIQFDTIDLEFYEKFKNFLLKKGLYSDTVLKYFKSVKTFMQWSLDRGYHNNTVFKHRDFFAKSTQKLPNVTLTREEF